jgi:mannose-6-phosphate isomerase-like protein (cupin superfamily)
MDLAPGSETGIIMNILRKKSAQRYQRDDITSYLLVSAGTCNAENLAITVVEMESGGFQNLHSHEPEQMYFILEGRGLMIVDDEEKPVQAGDCIFFPSFAKHGLKNTGKSVLRYLSAASPSFTLEQCKERWPLPPLE